MSILMGNFPEEIVSINDNLYFDTETLSDEDFLSDSKPVRYAVETSYRDIIDIMVMFEDKALLNDEKYICLLEMFYKDAIPKDRAQAVIKAVAFLDCAEEPKKSTAKSAQPIPRLWSWEQDGSVIYAAINYSHNNILKHEPNLHWWEFYSKLMQLKEDNRFSEIVNNRLAYATGKLTKEQRTARNQYPDIYKLKDQKKIDDKRLEAGFEMERMLNS